MAQPTTLPFGKFLVLLETAPGSGVFEAPCGFTEKALSLTAETNSQPIPDCDDPDAPIWTAREKTSRSANVTGSGVLAMEDYARWRTAYLANVAINVKVLFNLPGAQGGGFWLGPGHLTNLQQGSPLGQKGTLSVAIDSDGAWAWTDNP